MQRAQKSLKAVSVGLTIPSYKEPAETSTQIFEGVIQPSYQDGFQEYNCVWTFILRIFGEPVNDLKDKGSKELLCHLHRS